MTLPVVSTSSCHIDMAEFPFDEQTCQLVFGSVHYHSAELDMVSSTQYPLCESSSCRVYEQKSSHLLHSDVFVVGDN